MREQAGGQFHAGAGESSLSEQEGGSDAYRGPGVSGFSSGCLEYVAAGDWVGQSRRGACVREVSNRQRANRASKLESLRVSGLRQGVGRRVNGTLDLTIRNRLQSSERVAERIGACLAA
ncbi:hypothetical protein GCM10010459_23370 [Microbacterium schleiferi]